jgi:tetratricopeptide (TPR) repeat protein
MSTDGEVRWRVFISHTSELREYPDKGSSYIDAVERAISSEGHVIVDMRDFAAVDQTPADVCVERVNGCDVYIAVLGTRYGSPVRDQPDVSYTELEFNTATASEKPIPRLVFVIDTDADSLGIPPSALIDNQFGLRQEAFRQRVKGAGLVTGRFWSPDHLHGLVAQSLRTLADTLADETSRRISAGIEREQQPAEPPPVRDTKFVNRPPMTAPSSFQDRHVETGLVARFLDDPALRMITVVGRGGVGKTAMVCRLLKGLEAGRIEDVEGDLATMPVDGIVYLSEVGRHQITYENLVYDLARLLPTEKAEAINTLYRDPASSVEDVIYALLDALPDGRVVVLLDNLESLLDPATDSLIDASMSSALIAVLRAPEHAVKLIATTRVIPKDVALVCPASQHLLRLDEGLGSPDAEFVLRALDPDGSLGLRDASDELLGRVRERTRGFPRALEAVKGILFDRSITVSDLLDQTAGVGADDIVEVLIGEAYDRLDPAAQRVMQALAVYHAPVSAVAVDYLLQPSDPTINAAPILGRLVNRALARRDAGLFYLHPVDRTYALDQIDVGQPGDSPATHTLSGLRSRAADYLTQIRTPRETWRSIDDLDAQLAEFELRCDNLDHDQAATILVDIGSYLQLWGHLHRVVELDTRVDGHVEDPTTNMRRLCIVGVCHYDLGNYRHAIGLQELALQTAREAGDRRMEVAALGCLGQCFARLGDPRSRSLYEQALAIAQEIGDRQGEGLQLGSLAASCVEAGDHENAVDLHEQALAIAREVGDREMEATLLSNLGNCYRALGDYPRAADLYSQGLEIAQDLGAPGVEGTIVGMLALCYSCVGDFATAIDLSQTALEMRRHSGERHGECVNLGNLGYCYSSLGDFVKAAEHMEVALAIARDLGQPYLVAMMLQALGEVRLASGDALGSVSLFNEAIAVSDGTTDAQPSAEARAHLARAQLEAGDTTAAMSAIARAHDLDYPPIEDRLALLEGCAYILLAQPDIALTALDRAIERADQLLVLTPRNFAALYNRGLALSASALIGDPGDTSRAVDALRAARAVTAAPGVVGEAVRLLEVLGAVDNAGALPTLRAALEGTDG